MLENLLFSGFTQGAIYALVALSMTLVYRATTIVNFAHGDFVMAGACLVYVTTVVMELPYSAAAPIAFFSLFLAGMAFQSGLLRPIALGPHLSLAIMTIALSYILRGMARFIWGREIVAVPDPFSFGPIEIYGVIITSGDVAIIGAVSATFAAFYLIFYHTRVGKQMNAAYQSERGAALVGINVERLKIGIWGLCAAMGALGGILIAPVTLLYPDMGAGILIRAFAAMTLGGFGSLVGAVVGGLLLGLGEVLAGAYISTALIDVSCYIVIIAILVLRPNGLFGRASLARV